MLSHLRTNAVGYLALVVAMSGTSYAAVQLKAGQVKAKHLHKNAVTSKKVKDGSLTAADLKAGTLPTPPALPLTLLSGSSSGVITGAASPDGVLAFNHGFTVKNSGPGLLRVRVDLVGANCSIGLARFGIYLDGAPVPNGSVQVGNVAAQRDEEIVAPINLTAGDHLVQAAYDCPSGTLDASSSGSGLTWMVLQTG